MKFGNDNGEKKNSRSNDLLHLACGVSFLALTSQLIAEADTGEDIIWLQVEQSEPYRRLIEKLKPVKREGDVLEFQYFVKVATVAVTLARSIRPNEMAQLVQQRRQAVQEDNEKVHLPLSIQIMRMELEDRMRVLQSICGNLDISMDEWQTSKSAYILDGKFQIIREIEMMREPIGYYPDLSREQILKVLTSRQPLRMSVAKHQYTLEAQIIDTKKSGEVTQADLIKADMRQRLIKTWLSDLIFLSTGVEEQHLYQAIKKLGHDPEIAALIDEEDRLFKEKLLEYAEEDGRDIREFRQEIGMQD